MTEVQRHAAAAGFLHVLHTSPEVYNEWSHTPQDDAAKVGELIRRHVGLAEAPGKADLHAMAAYVDSHLKHDATEFHKAHPGGPHHVGIVYLMQQS
ncbi:MAG TPA: hypothetical protein VMF11_15310 [Candidatus Baltobacteraceae bacterium]|nr:hypothetical protein [Candidatus Baltobacteraceae bacterium]